MKNKLILFGLLALILAGFLLQRRGEVAPLAANQEPSPLSGENLMPALAKTDIPVAAQQPGSQPKPDEPVISATEANRVLAELPAGTFRSSLLLLEPKARAKALDLLGQLSVPHEDYASLHVAPSGDLYYVCAFESSLTPNVNARSSLSESARLDDSAKPTLEARQSSSGPHETTPTQRLVMAASVAISSPPVRHSRPGATKVLYLDFNGHTISGTIWNEYNAVGTYEAVAYDTDGDASTFSDSEQGDIIDIWARVAEDFAPFDVDVTTQEPALSNTTGRAVITRNTDANGTSMPSSWAGGVAFVGYFGQPNYATFYSPVFAYYNNLDGTSARVAETVSHELGHSLGLSHDGQTNGTEYYQGHGTGETSWRPIMGSGFGKNVTQWSKGEYLGANNTQDDLAIITAKIGYRADEAGASIATATSLTLGAGTTTAQGALAGGGDLDCWRIEPAVGPVYLGVSSFHAAQGTGGGNADLKIELLDASGGLVGTADPLGTTGATLDFQATGGAYYVRIASAGTGTPFANPPTGYTSYGSIGQYTLTVVAITGAPVITSPATASIGGGHDFNYQIQATNFPVAYGATGLPSGLSIDSASGIISGRPQMVGTFEIILTASNSLGVGSTAFTLTVADAPPAIESQSDGLIIRTPGLVQTLSVSADSINGPISYQWFRNNRLVDGATESSLVLSETVLGSTDYYYVRVSNAIGATTSGVIYVRTLPELTQVEAWGDNASGQRNVPVNLTGVVAVSAGEHFSLALKNDGTVVSWGATFRPIPAGLSGIVAISAGGGHALALKSDGTVVAWEPGYGSSAQPATVPDGLTGVVAISAGHQHSLALKQDGTVVAWGWNGNNQASVPLGLTGVVGISAGEYQSLAVKNDGTVVRWGSAGYFNPNVLSGVVAVSAGTYSLALKNDGTVVAWDNNSSSPSMAFTNLSGVIALAAGSSHSLVLKSDGAVVAWGGNSSGQSTIPASLANVLAISASRGSVSVGHSVILRNASGEAAPIITVDPVSRSVIEDTVVTFTVTVQSGLPVSYQWRKDGVAITGATSASFALSAAKPADMGNYDVVVTNQIGSATSAQATLVVAAFPTLTSETSVRRFFEIGQPLSFEIVANGTGVLTYQWYHNGRIIAGANAANYSIGTATKASAGAYWVTVTDDIGLRRSAPFFVLKTPGKAEVRAWGLNASGQSVVPGTLVDPVAIAAGWIHSLVLQKDGKVLAWGDNASLESSVPADLTNVVAIAAGQYHSLALKSDGTVVAWGENTYGQCNVPVGLTGVVAIAGGANNSFALKTDGTLVRWGIANVNEPANLSDIVGVVSGLKHTLVLKNNGTVVAWGDNASGQSTVPGGLTGVTEIYAGPSTSFAKKSDGTFVTWGTNSAGQGVIPAGVSDVAVVAGGNVHLLAVQNNGFVLAWGNNNYGQVSVPTGMNAAVAVAAGGFHSLALRDIPWSTVTLQQSDKELSGNLEVYTLNLRSLTEGIWVVENNAAWVSLSQTEGVGDAQIQVVVAANITNLDRTATIRINGITHTILQRAAATMIACNLWGMGDGNSRQLGFAPPRLQPSQLASPVVTGASGNNHGLFVKADGTLWAIGNNSNGQLGDGTSANRSSPVQVVSGVVKAAAGSMHSLFVKTDGTLWAMGNNTWGQAGFGSSILGRSIPMQIASGVVKVAAGQEHSLFVKTDGTLWATGLNSNGQLGDGGAVYNRSSPVQVATEVVTVAAGGNHSLFIKTDGTLWAMGLNTNGQLGDGTAIKRSNPVQVATEVVAVAAGSNHSLFIKTDGTLWAMGLNTNGQLGDGTSISRSSPVQVAVGVAVVAASGNYSVFVKTDGTLWAMGLNSSGQLGDGTITSRSSPVLITQGVEQVFPGGSVNLFLKIDGTLWGNGSYNLNPASDIFTVQGYRTKPVLIASSISGFSGGSLHSLFVKTDGTLWAMGDNANGQLGDGTTTSRSDPVQVRTEVLVAVAGGAHSLFVKTDGTLWAMGNNGSGRLGDGTTTSRNSPVKVASLVAAAAAGQYHSVFVKLDGTLWAMGANANGQLGDGTITSRSSPVQVAAGVVAAAAGGAHSLFVKTDGTLWVVGLNTSGQLGTGTTTTPVSPVQITSDVVAVAAGSDHSLFIKTDRTLWAMGSNASGQLGDGTLISKSTPVQISSDVVSCAAGSSHSLFVKADGTVWAMGTNSTGQLGDGTFVNRSMPVKIASGSVSIVAGGSHSLFLASESYTGASMPELTWPNPGTITFGTALSAVQLNASANVMGSFTYSPAMGSVLNAGTYTLTATFTPTDAISYSGASAQRTLTVDKAVAAVTLDGFAVTYDGAPKVVTVTTMPVGLAVGLTYAGSVTAPTAAGSYAVEALINEGNYTGSASGTLVIGKAAQTITFAGPADQSFNAAPLTLSATATSSLPVSFSLLSGPATLNGDSVTLTGAGTVTLRASQLGNDNYLAAPAVDRSFAVSGNFDSWLRDKFTPTELADPLVSGAAADPDGDGLGNLMEYALGLEPKSADTAGLPEAGPAASDWTYTYTRPADRNDLTYEVEVSTNLTTWTTAGVAHGRVGTGMTETWQASYPLATAANLFFRLKVSQ